MTLGLWQNRSSWGCLTDVLNNSGIRQKDEAGHSTENDESDGSDGSDVEENKIFKELTSEIDEIISL